MTTKHLIAAILAMVVTAGTLAGCAPKTSGTDTSSTESGAADSTSSGTAASTPAGTPDTSKSVNLVYYLWGSHGVGVPRVLEEINKKLKADINATLDIKLIDWPDTSTKYPLLFASGEQFDMSHASPTAPVSYYTLASQDALADITDLLATSAPTLKAEIPADTWKGNEYKGRIYGVPSLYSEFTPTGYAYSTNLLEKYNLPPITDIASMEAYMDQVAKNEQFAPITGNAVDAQNMYRMLVETTNGWLEAPGIASNEMYLVAESKDDYKNIIHPAFTQEFEDWAVKMREWADKGYFNKDILSAQLGGKDNMLNGKSGGWVTHMADWTGTYGGLLEQQPDLKTDFYTFAESNGKIKRKMGVENSTVISVNSKNQERALMAIEKFMTDESYYRLMQYGIDGVQYEVVDGIAVKPASYNKDTDAAGFSAWSLRNDRLNIPYATEDPRRYVLNEEWKKVAINDPFMGFSFENKAVSSEISSISNVNSQLGIQLMLGKTPNDVKEAVAQYRDQLTKAGIDKVIAELKTQLEAFTPIG